MDIGLSFLFIDSRWIELDSPLEGWIPAMFTYQGDGVEYFTVLLWRRWHGVPEVDRTSIIFKNFIY